jgi:hypothetical protein
MGMLSCVEWLGREWLSGAALVVLKCPTTPRAVIPAKAGIQYTAAYRLNHWRLWNTGTRAYRFSGGVIKQNPATRPGLCI